MKTSKACGWILVSPGPRTLLLQNRERGDWGVPKGHMEANEDERQTACRELHEETGLELTDLSVDPHFRQTLSYHVKAKHGNIHLKEVVYFRANCLPHTISLSQEHCQFEWASRPRVQTLITHNNLRHLILETMSYGY